MTAINVLQNYKMNICKDRENGSILKYKASNLIYVPHNETAHCFYFVATQNLIKIEIGKTDVI